MTTRYRVEYALKSHRRDEFIEWIKGLLAVPFVLHATPDVYYRAGDDTRSSAEARRRYAEIFFDVQCLIDTQIRLQRVGNAEQGRLKQLVPSIGTFFTKLPLERAFYVQDDMRSISTRRLVSPSFNDVRLILNSAQVMSLAEGQNPMKLVTFDGDVTLYDDGKSLEKGSLVIGKLIDLLSRSIHIGIVTAAGYSDHSGERYFSRLEGLLTAIAESDLLTCQQKDNLYVMGGESNYLFQFKGSRGSTARTLEQHSSEPHSTVETDISKLSIQEKTVSGPFRSTAIQRASHDESWTDSSDVPPPDTSHNYLEWIDPSLWTLPEVTAWPESDISSLLDIAESVLTTSLNKMKIPGEIIRKARGVGLVAIPGERICREQLEEVVLNAQRRIEITAVGKRVHFCAFNGGSDVWVDIGDKRLGVMSLQRHLGGISGYQTLHVGDQFASVGANDFKARLAACTVWIASPKETVDIIEELIVYLDEPGVYH